MPSNLDQKDWVRLLERLGTTLGAAGDPVRLCLIGSAACLLEAMPGRTSRDLNVWQPASEFDLAELRTACEAAGLVLDPKAELEPDRPYLQIVRPGLSQTGDFEPVFWGRFGRLHLYLPPAANLIASKLVRADRRDVEDVLFLAARHGVTADAVRACAEGFPEPARKTVMENLVYLEIVSS